MTVSLLSLPFDIKCMIASYIPDENILRISGISRDWRYACSDLDPTYLKRRYIEEYDCSRIFLILDSDQLQTEEFQKIATPSLIEALFMRTLLLMDEKHPLTHSKKNIFYAEQIRAILLKKFPSIINKNYVIKKLAEACLTESDSMPFFNSITEKYLKNERLTSDEIYCCLEACVQKWPIVLKEMLIRETFIIKILLKGKFPFRPSSNATPMFCYNLKQAQIRAKKQKNIFLLLKLKKIEKRFFNRKEPTIFSHGLWPLWNLWTDRPELWPTWNDLRSPQLIEKAILFITNVLKTLHAIFIYALNFIPMVTINLLMTLLSFIFPQTIEKFRTELEEKVLNSECIFSFNIFLNNLLFPFIEFYCLFRLWKHIKKC
jgi:hypothetical protein